MNVTNASDRQLVERARRGSPESSAELVRRHWRDAWARAYAVLGRRAQAEDVAQDALAVALERIGELKDPAAFGGWVSRIATRRAIDVLRRESRDRAADEWTQDTAVEWEGASGEAADLRRAITRLDPDRRSVVILRFWLDLTPTEIARILEIPVGTANSRIARALGDLRAILEEAPRA